MGSTRRRRGAPSGGVLLLLLLLVSQISRSLNCLRPRPPPSPPLPPLPAARPPQPRARESEAGDLAPAYAAIWSGARCRQRSRLSFPPNRNEPTPTPAPAPGRWRWRWSWRARPGSTVARGRTGGPGGKAQQLSGRRPSGHPADAQQRARQRARRSPSQRPSTLGRQQWGGPLTTWRRKSRPRRQRHDESNGRRRARHDDACSRPPVSLPPHPSSGWDGLRSLFRPFIYFIFSSSLFFPRPPLVTDENCRPKKTPLQA